MRGIVECVRYVHVFQTKGIFGQLEREITRIWLLWHPFVWIVIGWHLPARMGYPGLAPPRRTACLLRGGSRNIVVYDTGVIILLLGLGLWRSAACRRPPCGLWIKSPIALRPLMCADGGGELCRRGTGITGRGWRGPRTLIALWRVRGHARVGRTYVRRVNSWTPCRLSVRGSGHVRCLHRRSGLRLWRGQGGAGRGSRREL